MASTTLSPTFLILPRENSVKLNYGTIPNWYLDRLAIYSTYICTCALHECVQTANDYARRTFKYTNS